MRDNVFCLDSYRRKKAESSNEEVTSTEQAASIDFATWSKDIRLNADPSPTVRTTAVNVLADFRIHPVTRNAGQQQVKIVLRFDLLDDEQLKQVDFTERSTRLISRLLGRKVHVLLRDDILIYTTTHPQPR